MPDEEVQSLRRIYDALSRWDVDELVKDLAHDIELNLPESLPWGGTRPGHDGVRARESGQGFEVPFAHVWTLSDGNGSRCRAYFDSAPILAALESERTGSSS